MEVFIAMQLFDYNPRDNKILYITHKCCLDARISKNVNPKEWTSKHSVAIAQDSRPESERSLRNRNGQGEIVILIDHKEGQNSATEYSSAENFASPTSERSTQSKKLMKNANLSKDAFSSHQHFPTVQV